MPVVASPIVTTGLGEQIADALRIMMVKQELLPRERLVETSLAERFSVSRGPVREALHTLEYEGLVESTRQGRFVIGFTNADVADLFTLRITIERLAVRIIVERRPQIDWRPFETFVAGMRDSAGRSDPAGFNTCDLQFHAEGFRQSGNRRLLTVWNSYEKTLAALLDYSERQGVDLVGSAEEHALLLERYRTGTSAEALATLEQHLTNAQTRLLGRYSDI